jgi:hypothetical protein
MYDKVSYVAEIKWVESYGMQRCSKVFCYEVGAQMCEGQYKLITFEIQQKRKPID